MRFLLTVHQFFPNYFSGTEVLTYSVAKELLRRGHTVAVLTGFPARTQMADAERFDEYDLEGVHVYRFHHAYVPMGEQNVTTEIEYDNHLAAQYFALILQQFKPDIVHFFHLSRLGAGLIDAVVAAGIPAYATPTDFYTICPTSQLLLHGGNVCGGPSPHAGNCVKHVAELTRGPKARMITRFVPDWVADTAVKLTADGTLPPYPLHLEVAAMHRRKNTMITRMNWLNGIVAPTNLMTRVLTSNGVDPNLILNANYGIDVGGYDAQPAERTAERPLVVCFIGTLAPHKGCHVLIEAFKRLPTGTARLKVYGNPADFPEYYAGLQKRAEGVDHIEFLGTFPNHEIGKIIAGIDILVVPSLWYENTPLVVYSSLAAKRPVLASDFPGLSETIKHDWNGLIFTPGDFTALYACLKRLIDTPALLGDLSRNCHPPKSTVQYVDELLALYETGLPSRPQRDLSALRTLPPLDRTDRRGSLTGWAIADFGTPSRITLQTGDTVQGQTARFLPRPDVRDGLKRAGMNIKGHTFGFTIRLPDGIDRDRAALHWQAENGRTIVLPLRDIARGKSVSPSTGDYIAIDSEQLLWQVQSEQAPAASS